jgi:hypothetical protein
VVDAELSPDAAALVGARGGHTVIFIFFKIMFGWRIY